MVCPLATCPATCRKEEGLRLTGRPPPYHRTIIEEMHTHGSALDASQVQLVLAVSPKRKTVAPLLLVPHEQQGP